VNISEVGGYFSAWITMESIGTVSLWGEARDCSCDHLMGNLY
jgi:hypothetical protein